MKKNFAAIDIGTNSIRLVVVRTDSGKVNNVILDREREVVRLGTGATDMKFITDRAMDRGIETLRRFGEIAASYNAFVRAVATSAVREALNKDVFIERAKNEAGIKVEVVSGFEEARLIYLGVAAALPVSDKKILLLDIGGGSSEFILAEKGNIVFASSLKLGCIRMTDKYFPGGIMKSKGLKDCAEYVRGVLVPVTRKLKNEKYEIAIGTSGTISAVSSMINMRRSEARKTPIGEVVFDRKEFEDLLEELLSLSLPEKISGIPGIDPRRSDIIAGGAAVLATVLDELKIEKIRFCDSSLKEGLIFDTISRFGASRKPDNIKILRENSIKTMTSTLNVDLKHVKQVEKLALVIFDKLKNNCGFSNTERDFLRTASLLHDTGFFISHEQHHWHSYYLIKNFELAGFTDTEKEIIANIARYHRKSHPKLKHEGFSSLNSEDQVMVSKLSGILRIADGLDRSRNSLVKDIKIKQAGRNIYFKIKPYKGGDIGINIWGAQRKMALFEEAFCCRLSIS